MFEKEAIIHAFEETIGIECLNKPVEDFTYEELSDELQEKAYDFKKGAEFGYNKCKEELNQKGLALQSDMDKTIEQNIALKKELNKANEWHFVKDGDYPKKKVFILLLGKEHITLKNMANGDLMLMFLMQMMDILKVVEILLSPGKKLYFQKLQRGIRNEQKS